MYRVSLPITTYTQEDHLKKEYLHGLHKRRIDEKFSYIGKRQTDAWLNICKSKEYEYYRNSKKLLENKIKDFVSDYKTDVNVIAFGPGDALKEKVVVDAFLENHQVSLFFVDISREMLDVAIKNTEDSDVLKEVFIADLRDFMRIKGICHHIKKHYNATNFFTFLGNTMGNYPQAMILKTIRSAMAPGDKILLDADVKVVGSLDEEVAHIDRIVQEYKNNPTYLEKTLASLSEAGIKETDGCIEVDFGRDDFFTEMDVVKQYFRFNRSRVITYQGEDVYFANSERILVHYSNKYTFKALENILTSHGLRIIEYDKDSTGECYLMLCELA